MYYYCYMELILKNHDLTHSFFLLFEEYQEKIKTMKEICDSQSSRSNVLTYFLRANQLRATYDELFNFDKAKSVLNSEMWNRVIQMTNVLHYMPAEDRNKWTSDISEYNTPDFTEDNVIPTVQGLLKGQNTFFAKKVDGIFRNLSGDHVTNSPSGFSKRMIFVVNNYHGSLDSDKTAFLDDLRFSISKILENKEDFKLRRTYDDLLSIERLNEYGKWFSLDGGSLKIKIFKKGTAHLEVDPYVAIKLNQVLAHLYPTAIAPKNRKLNTKIKKFELKNDFLNEAVQGELLSIIQKLRYSRSFFYYPTSLKKEDANKVSEIIQLLDGIVVDRHVSFSYDPSDILVKMKLNGYIPERKSHQFYPTESSLADLAVSMLRIDEWDNILEPSAGNGRLIDKVKTRYKKRITCVEISKTHSEILLEKGYNVENMDFLEYPTEKKYNKIIMNPPFTKNQAKTHVIKACSHLNDEGQLIAIVPSSLQNLEIKGFSVNSTKTIENAFIESKTKVSVVILRITRK